MIKERVYYDLAVYLVLRHRNSKDFSKDSFEKIDSEVYLESCKQSQQMNVSEMDDSALRTLNKPIELHSKDCLRYFGGLHAISQTCTHG